MTVSWSDHGRIMVGSAAVFEKFLRNFGESFCVAGAVFGEFGQ